MAQELEAGARAAVAALTFGDRVAAAVDAGFILPADAVLINGAAADTPIGG